METQGTAENLTARSLAAEQRLLAEGIPSYLDAMTAIQELRQNIQKRCKRVLCEGREEFEKAIGMTLDATKIDDYSSTDTAGCVYLGAQIPLLMGEQRAGIAYVALTLSKEDDQSPVITVFICIQ